jgi:disulfide bond formation protein DsbB
MKLQTHINKMTPKCLLRLMAIASLGMLAAALVGQYGFGWHPCDLCLKQRYPYAAIAALGLLGAWFVKSPKLLFAIAWLCVLLFAVDAGIAFYHTGVEMGWFTGPSACSNTGTGEQTLEEMRAAIMNAPLVSCDQAMAYVLGLSLAAWNVLAASLLAVFSAAMLLNFHKRKI